MKPMIRAWLVWTLAGALQCGGAGIAQGAIFDTAEKVAAAADNARTNQWADPVGYVTVRSNGLWYLVGSGTLVRSNVVILAAHQLVYVSGYDAVRFTLRYITNIIDRSVADSWVSHPMYPGRTAPGTGVDLALVHLSAPITNAAPATLLDGPLSLPVVMSMAGFGLPGVVGSEPWPLDVIKRAGENVVGDTWSHWFEQQFVLCRFNEPGYSNCRDLEWQLTSFDSGSGWFVQTNGSYNLAAIGCFYDPLGTFNYNSYSGALDITRYRGWIENTIQSFTPTLKITLTEAGQPKLTWPSPAPGYALQESADLSSATNWIAVMTQPTDDGTNKSVVVGPSSGSRFWRLAK